MAMYIVYDQHNGQIVHTHVQSEDLPMSREALMALLERGQDHARLATILVDPKQVTPEGLYRVDPKSRELQPVDDQAAAGFGMGAVTNLSAAGAISPMKVTYTGGEAQDYGG